MKKKVSRRLWLSREVRIGFIVALLALVGVYAVTHHARGFGLVLIGFAAAITAAFWYVVIRPARIPHGAVITIRLAGPIHEDPLLTPLDQLRRRGLLSMRSLRYALESIVADAGVKGIIVEIAGPEAGIATCHEIQRLLRAAHLRGKRVVALLSGDSAGVRDLLIASGASEVVANPDTMLELLGVAAGGVFLKSGLEKLGVHAQTLQWKEYKGAAETFSRDAMSPALRESLDAIITDARKVLTDTIAEARNLPAARVDELLSAGFVTVPELVEVGLVDRAGYREEIRDSFDDSPESKIFVTFHRYLRHAIHVRERGRRPRIAIVTASGPVIAGEAPATGEYISAPAIAAEFDRASRDEQVSAIVFRINSPGGSAVGSDIVWRAVRQAQGRGKPVIVSMGDVAGSGGYYIAAGADAIVAEPATITGSIGVVWAKFSLASLLERAGVHFDFVKSSDNADANSISRAMTEPEIAQLDRAIGSLYGNFVSRVSEGRKLSFEQAEALAHGRVWSGIAAKERGLVDETGGFERAVEIARELANIERKQEVELIDYRAERQIFGFRLAMGSEAMPPAIELLAQTLGLPARWAPAMLAIVARGGVMLLCPFLGL